MKRLKILNTAHVAMENLRAAHPHDAAVVSVCKQLDYLLELAEGKREDRERLNDIIIGVLTMREIEPLDQDAAELLYLVVEEVDKMKAEGH
jgi:hypothetical protein